MRMSVSSKKAPAPTKMEAGDPFDHLAEMLRTLFSAKAGADVCPDCGHSPCQCDEEDDDESASDERDTDAAEDAAEYGARPKGAGPFGALPMKGMRRVSISILMPMGKKPSPKA
jgi:hypothetical protein